MKRILLVAASAAFAFTVQAQDVIVLKDATEIEAKVVNISEDDLTYQKWTNLDGPSYTISKSSVLFVKYQNGEKEVFKVSSTPSQATDKSNRLMRLTNSDRFGKVTFQGYFDVAGYFGEYMLAPSFDLSLGVRVWDLTYVGFETGFTYPFIKYRRSYSGTWAVPLGANIKEYIPTGTKAYPFIDMTLGAMAVDDGFPFHCHLMVGCDFNRFSLAIGWDRLDDIDTFGLKLGVRIGK